jgi:predicted RNase H-like nuclease (RuvC/YqgF family)
MGNEEAVQRGIDQILANLRSFETVMEKKITAHDKDIDTLYNARNDLTEEVTKLQVKIELLNKERDEYRADLKDSRSEMMAMQEKVISRMDLAFAFKNENCKIVHNNFEVEVVKAHESFAEKFSGHKKYVEERFKNLGLSTRNWILVSVAGTMGALFTAILIKVFVK